MTMTLPALTALSVGQVVQAADLTAMTYACTFLMTKPIARVHQSASGQTLAASGSAATAVTWNTADFDTDSMWGGSGTSSLFARTPGFYKVRYTVNTNNITGNGWVRVTTGANNPQGAGVTVDYIPSYVFGFTNNSICGASGVIPLYMYVNDFVAVYFQGNIASTVEVAPVPPSLSMEWLSI
jgi:hypothetical protein